MSTTPGVCPHHPPTVPIIAEPRVGEGTSHPFKYPTPEPAVLKRLSPCPSLLVLPASPGPAKARPPGPAARRHAFSKEVREFQRVSHSGCVAGLGEQQVHCLCDLANLICIPYQPPPLQILKFFHIPQISKDTVRAMGA